ncbi:Hypothetical protein GbCGDNIH4_7116 [Granulibacter bethesdensis CGDNIH4]|nr:Hypothetical protein GbCGDNIH4_7116 [Granulibacter bethesdensis CGDNIH4]
MARCCRPDRGLRRCGTGIPDHDTQSTPFVPLAAFADCRGRFFSEAADTACSSSCLRWQPPVPRIERAASDYHRCSPQQNRSGRL